MAGQWEIHNKSIDAERSKKDARSESIRGLGNWCRPFWCGCVWELPMKCTRFHGLRPCRCCTLSEWQGEAVTNDSLPCCPREQSLACPSNSRPKRRNTESLSPCQINRDESTQRLFEVGAHNSITKCSLR